MSHNEFFPVGNEQSLYKMGKFFLQLDWTNHYQNKIVLYQGN